MIGTNLFVNKTSVVQGNTECYYPGPFQYWIPSATGHGGAIYCDHCNITAHGHLHFSKNAAYDSGGALELEAGSAVMQGTITFDGNSANISGRAI